MADYPGSPVTCAPMSVNQCSGVDLERDRRVGSHVPARNNARHAIAPSKEKTADLTIRPGGRFVQDGPGGIP